MAAQRLQKIIAQAGVASRRAAEDLITGGRVRVNGLVVRTLGSRADPRRDTVEVEGQGVLGAEPHVYIAMHKPEMVVSTVADPEGRLTVVKLLDQSRAQGHRLFEGNLPRVYPVGRLDFDAAGILLLTNDGNLTQTLLHPRHHVPKVYMVKVRGRPDAAAITRLRTGVRLREPDGSLSRSTSTADVRVVKAGGSNSWIEMTLFEGRYHQVKRMCDAVGHSVVRLVRTQFGGIDIDTLEPGSWRFLTRDEVDSLRRWAQRGPPARRGTCRAAHKLAV